MPSKAEPTEREGDSNVEVLAHEEALDKHLVQESMVFIRTTLEHTLNKGVTEIGDHVLKKFFGDDPERVRSRNPNKNASFRLLTENCGTADLPISKSFLQRAVAVAVMRKLLLGGGTAFKQLPPSHQATLVPLREPEKVEKLAGKALSKKLSLRDLSALVTDELAKKEPDGRGRKPRPVIVKTLSRSVKLFTLESGRRSFTKAQVDELTDEDAKAALKTAKSLVESLNKLIGRLEERG